MCEREQLLVKKLSSCDEGYKTFSESLYEYAMDELLDEIDDRLTINRRPRNSPEQIERHSGEKDENEPVDSNSVAYWSCVILGISTLLPWNLFITAHQYFSYKFSARNVSFIANTTERNGLESSFEVYFALTGSAAGFLASAANVVIASYLSANTWMISGHLLVILSLLPSFIFTFIDTDTWRTGFFILNLFLIVFGQVGCTFMAGSTFGLAAKFPDGRFTNGVISAQAFAGIFTSVISIISLAIGSTERPSVVGAIYFALALVFVFISLAVYFMLQKNNYARYHMKKAESSIYSDDVEPLLVDPQSDTDSDFMGSVPSIEVTSGRRSLANFIKKTVYHGLVMMMTLMATLVCFPGLTSLVRSAAPVGSLWQYYFIPVTCFLLFNVMDFVGRLLGNWKLWPKPDSPLIGLIAMVRFGFVFLFIFCNLPPYGLDGKRQIFSDDTYFVLFVACLGLTNGYLANLGAIYLPASVDKIDSDRAGAATNFFLAIGVLMGSIISLFVVRYVAG